MSNSYFKGFKPPPSPTPDKNYKKELRELTKIESEIKTASDSINLLNRMINSLYGDKMDVLRRLAVEDGILEDETQRIDFKYGCNKPNHHYHISTSETFYEECKYCGEYYNEENK